MELVVRLSVSFSDMVLMVISAYSEHFARPGNIWNPEDR